MTAWVDCASPSPAYFGGWAADMGEYIGPWPMMPPPVITGGAGSDEIDFVLGFPNPAHPGDPYYALDDSYSSPIWNNWRFLTIVAPGSRVGYRRTYSGTDASFLPSSTDVPPPGVHLYVVAYFASGEPTDSPESYVPRAYAAGGTCLYETIRGALSDWQSGIPRSGTVNQLSYDYLQNGTTHEQEVSGVGGEAPDPWLSLHDLVQAQLDAVAATTWDFDPAHFATFSGGTAAAGLSRYWGKAWSFFDFHHRDAHVGVAPLVVQYDASPTQDFPEPLVSMTAGVDYSPIPWTDDDVYEYESPVPAVFAWDDLTARIQIDVNNLYGSALDHTPYTATVHFSSLAVYPSAPVTVITGGDTLLEVAIDETSATVSDHPIGLAGIGTRLIVNAAMTFWEDGLIGDLAPDLTDPLIDGTGGEYDFSYHVALGVATYRWVTSRWRYELPDQVVPVLAWHNFTGHYANFTGATHYIFTPGLGPVPMADGLPA